MSEACVINYTQRSPSNYTSLQQFLVKFSICSQGCVTVYIACHIPLFDYCPNIVTSLIFLYLQILDGA